ncbi:hypothetical protein [Methanosarcina horonobensis]|uniref:hypothetical protein n=1 Tax=Methanosarcina horonobensis TaxID=418008 RepID=UPI000AC09BF2|nr:hypothetical protein [Methanosarcina horonobensis]
MRSATNEIPARIAKEFADRNIRYVHAFDGDFKKFKFGDSTSIPMINNIPKTTAKKSCNYPRCIEYTIFVIFREKNE